MKAIVILIFTVIFSPVLWAQHKVSADVEVKRVNKGQSMTIRKEIYYNTNGKMVVRFVHPEEYFVVTNHFGEARIYLPKTNEVMLINDRSMSSESELIYYFLNNKIEDLGLKNQGFSLGNTRTEQGVVVRTYFPNDKKSNISKIEMVHENHLPIYCAYYDSKNRIIRKIYYSDYQHLSLATFPRRITEIAYPTMNDSVVSRMVYSNIKIDRQASSPYFDFSIPSNATVVDNSKLFQQPQQQRRRR
ncbi:MAG: hypothetical protein FWE63_07720 [Bacteroidales bacterium]|nr:hypothetical protein [Bacteroidales bacterium]